MAAKKVIKVDDFRVIYLGGNQYKVDGKDCGGKRSRFRFTAETDEQAIRKAGELLRYPETRSQFPKLSIEEAFERAAASRNWRTKETGYFDGKAREYFSRWLETCLTPSPRYWHELKPSHIEAYLSSLQGKAQDTKRLYLVPIRRTAKWMAREWPNYYQDICQGVRLPKRESRLAYDGGRGTRSLSIHDVLSFLDYLMREAPALAAPVALQGLCGLQLQEVCRLRWSDIDLQESTVTIQGEVKNPFRVRRIPVCQTALWLLRQAIYLRGDIRPGLVNGCKIVASGWPRYAERVRRALHSWDSARAIPPSDLRNTIQTAAVEGGWYGYYVQRYVGHAPKTVGERHYVESRGDAMLAHFKAQVVDKIEASISTWKAPEGSRLFTGLRVAQGG